MAIGNEGHCAGNGLIVFQGLEGGAEEVCQEGDGDGAGAGLLAAVAAGEASEGFTGVRDEGEGEGELLYLAGVLPVLEGVEVAFGGACAGAGVLRVVRGGSRCWEALRGYNRTHVLEMVGGYGRGWQSSGEWHEAIPGQRELQPGLELPLADDR